jgi:hypothetical protein
VVERLRCAGEQLGVIVGVGELEERQRRAVGQAEERVAVLPFLAPDVLLLAPGGHEGHAQDVLVEVAGPLLVGHDVGVVVEAAGKDGRRHAPSLARTKGA